MWKPLVSKRVASRFVGSFAALLFVSAGSAYAVPLTYTFTGTASTQTGIYAGQGTAVTGFYTVESTLIDFSPSPDLDTFPVETNPSAAWEISVTNGAITRSTATNRSITQTDILLFPNHHVLQVVDDPERDAWILLANRILISDDPARLIVQDLPSDGVDPDAIAIGSGNLTGMPITTPGDLSLYNNFFDRSFYRAYSASGQLEGQVLFTLTSVTLVPVPEPGTALLMGLGLTALAARRKA